MADILRLPATVTHIGNWRRRRSDRSAVRDVARHPDPDLVSDVEPCVVIGADFTPAGRRARWHDPTPDPWPEA